MILLAEQILIANQIPKQIRAGQLANGLGKGPIRKRRNSKSFLGFLFTYGMISEAPVRLGQSMEQADHLFIIIGACLLFRHPLGLPLPCLPRSRSASRLGRSLALFTSALPLDQPGDRPLDGLTKEREGNHLPIPSLTSPLNFLNYDLGP